MKSFPLTVPEWRRFLGDYSSKFLNSDYFREAESEGVAQNLLSEAQREAGWLGDEPASAEKILAVEERLGVRLPPTYRNFLLTSNGWSSMGNVELYKVDEIGWFPDLESELFEAWVSADQEDTVEILKRCLLIADDDGGAGCYWLLLADSSGDKDEWTAYEWWPGDELEGEDNFAALVSTAEKALS